MVTIDYIIIAIVLVSAVTGLIQGFLREVCSLVTWVLAVWLAWKFGPLLVPYLGGALRAGAVWTLGRSRASCSLACWCRRHHRRHRQPLVAAVDVQRHWTVCWVSCWVCCAASSSWACVVVLAQQVKLDGEAWWRKSRLLPQVRAGRQRAAGDGGRTSASRPASQD